jgi:hypothetical protein
MTWYIPTYSMPNGMNLLDLNQIMRTGVIIYIRRTSVDIKTLKNKYRNWVGVACTSGEFDVWIVSSLYTKPFLYILLHMWRKLQKGRGTISLQCNKQRRPREWLLNKASSSTLSNPAIGVGQSFHSCFLSWIPLPTWRLLPSPTSVSVPWSLPPL